MAEYEGFIRIQEALIEFRRPRRGFNRRRASGYRPVHTWLLNERVGLSCRLLDISCRICAASGSYQEIAYRDFAVLRAQAMRPSGRRRTLPPSRGIGRRRLVRRSAPWGFQARRAVKGGGI